MENFKKKPVENSKNLKPEFFKCFREFQQQHGNVLLELALILPILLLLLAGIVQFGFILNAEIAVNSAAYEAVRTATLSDNPSSAALNAVQNYAASSLPGWSFSERLKAKVNIPDINPGTLISVEVIYSIPIFFSNVFSFSNSGSSAMEIKGVSVMRIEEKE
jgi:hypothetical protein